MKSFTIVFSFVILLFSCSQLKEQTAIDNRYEKLYVFQDGYEKEINFRESEVIIKKKPFSLRFWMNRYNSYRDKKFSATISASLSDDIFYNILVGMTDEETKHFSIAFCLAGSNTTGYSNLFIRDNTTHFVYYENEDDKRLNFLKYKNDSYHEDLMYLEFPVKAFYLDDKDVAISASSIDDLYLVIWFDRNLDRILDEPELYKLKILFQD